MPIPANAVASMITNKALVIKRGYDHFSPITGNQGLGAGLGRGLGEGATLGAGVNSIVSIGGLALSRVSNRFAVAIVVSSPNITQPKLPAGLSNHACTSATICAELHVY